MKVFIRSSEIGEDSPTVIATYNDDIDVPSNAHGEGTTMLTVPRSAIIPSPDATIAGRLAAVPPKLISGWRERAGQTIAEGEAKRRIDDVLPSSDQLITLHELIALSLQHGTDVSKWPTDAKNRKAEIDDAWNYVRAVKERARSRGPISGDPTNDRSWPTRIARKA
jgi:hypothetical protein